jgi:hypothetical protein
VKDKVSRALKKANVSAYRYGELVRFGTVPSAVNGILLSIPTQLESRMR